MLHQPNWKLNFFQSSFTSCVVRSRQVPFSRNLNKRISNTEVISISTVEEAVWVAGDFMAERSKNFCSVLFNSSCVEEAVWVLKNFLARSSKNFVPYRCPFWKMLKQIESLQRYWPAISFENDTKLRLCGIYTCLRGPAWPGMVRNGISKRTRAQNSTDTLKCINNSSQWQQCPY